jgi:hypothetical protein
MATHHGVVVLTDVHCRDWPKRHSILRTQDLQQILEVIENEQVAKARAHDNVLAHLDDKHGIRNKKTAQNENKIKQ